MCADGFMLENKVCVEANATANCAALSYDKQMCMSCDDGFFRDDGFCLECADECLTCSKRETTACRASRITLV